MKYKKAKPGQRPSVRFTGRTEESLDAFCEYYGVSRRVALVAAVSFLDILVPPTDKRKRKKSVLWLADEIRAGNLNSMFDRVSKLAPKDEEPDGQEPKETLD